MIEEGKQTFGKKVSTTVSPHGFSRITDHKKCSVVLFHRRQYSSFQKRHFSYGCCTGDPMVAGPQNQPISCPAGNTNCLMNLASSFVGIGR